MSERFLVRNARQLVTLRGSAQPRRGPEMRDLGIVPNGSVLIEDGRIVAAGDIDIPPDAEVYDASGKVVLPGFVDSHTHLVWTKPRLLAYEMRIAGATYAEIAAACGGIKWTMQAVREASPDQLLAEARRALNAFYDYGTTTVEAKSGYGLDEAAELKTLEIVETLRSEGHDVIPTYLGAHVAPPEFRQADDYIAWVCAEMLPQVARRKLAVFADVFCEEGAFTAPQTQTYLEAAKRCGLGLKLHAEQFTRSGAVSMGTAMAATSVDHLEAATADDARELARSKTIATLLPGAVFHLGSHTYPPARMLIDHGAAVALATDYNPGTSPTVSMPMILSLACTQMRMTPAEAITAATINGAHAVSAADRVGSLEPGKQGNLAVFDVSDYREIPYFFGMNRVAATFRKGKLHGTTTR